MNREQRKAMFARKFTMPKHSQFVFAFNDDKQINIQPTVGLGRKKGMFELIVFNLKKPNSKGKIIAHGKTKESLVSKAREEL